MTFRISKHLTVVTFKLILTGPLQQFGNIFKLNGRESKLWPVIYVADINSQSRIEPCRFCLKGNQDLNNRAKYGSRASLKHCWQCSTLQYNKLKELCGQASLRRQNLKIKFYLISFSLFKATKEVKKVQEGRFLYPLVSNQSIQTFFQTQKYSF